jgi:hypothetical protein
MDDDRLEQQAIADGGGLDIDQDYRAVESEPMSELGQKLTLAGSAVRSAMGPEGDIAANLETSIFDEGRQ